MQILVRRVPDRTDRLLRPGPRHLPVEAPRPVAPIDEGPSFGALRLGPA